jgi:hypothetical protein
MIFWQRAVSFSVCASKNKYAFFSAFRYLRGESKLLFNRRDHRERETNNLQHTTKHRLRRPTYNKYLTTHTSEAAQHTTHNIHRRSRQSKEFLTNKTKASKPSSIQAS